MDLTALDTWSSLSRALVATGVLLCIGKFIGSALVGRNASVYLQLIVGVNCTGLLGLAMGWVPQPIPMLLMIALATSIVLVGIVRECSTWKIQSQSFERSWWVSFAPSLHGWTMPKICGIFGVLITLGPALTYPSGWDELVYHVELPRRWLNERFLSVYSDLPYSALPSLPEVICWSVAPIEHLVAPRLIGWVMWVNGVLLFRESLRTVASAITAEVLVWAVVASRVSLMISANFYVESFLLADTAALCSILLVPKTMDRRSLHVAGLVLGGAIATKLIAIGLAAFLPVACWVVWSRSTVAVRHFVFSLCIAILFASPFYLRAWILCGNPFSPYFAGWFCSDPAMLLMSDFHHELAVGNFGISGWQGFLAASFALAFARELYDGSFGMQWIALLACCGFACYALTNKRSSLIAKQKELTAAFMLCGVLYTLWFVSSQQSRFAVSILMLAAFASAIYMEELKHQTKRALLFCVGILTMFSVPWSNSGYYLDSWLCVLKVFSPIDYIRDGVGDSYTALAIYLHSEVPHEDKIVTLFEHRLAYLPLGVEIATPYFQTKYFAPPQIPTSAQSIMEHLREHEVKYLVLTPTPAGPDVSTRFIDAQQEWFRGIDECIASDKLKVVWRSENHVVAQVSWD
ncbi:MAG: hypothetical protein ACK52L_24125 [Pirellula sp.]|jgi:hypothetical protein